MPDINKANRAVCDVDIRILKDKVPYLFFDTANTTTAGLTSDNVYAMAKGSRKIAFQNPLEATMSITAQVYPFKLLSLMSDGVIESSAVYAEHATVRCATAGELTIDVPTDGTVQAGTVFVFADGDFGGAAIEGTFAANKFTATTASNIAVGSDYEVAYMISRTSGVKKIVFNNKRMPKDYYITMKTVDKDEDGLLTPFVMTAYKATIQRNFELSFSSEGEPSDITLSFDLNEDKDGNVLDMIELTADAS